jgi:hypothetical protein
MRLTEAGGIGNPRTAIPQQVQELINQRIDIGCVGIRFSELESELVAVESTIERIRNVSTRLAGYW